MKASQPLILALTCVLIVLGPRTSTGPEHSPRRVQPSPRAGRLLAAPSRTLSADPIEDDFVVIPAADESIGAGQPAWDLDLGTPGPVTTMGAGPRKEAEWCRI